MDRCLMWKTSRGKAVGKRFMMESVIKHFFMPSFPLSPRSSLHEWSFRFWMYHEYKGCSLPVPNLCEVSIFPFHVMMGNSFFLSFFSGNSCTSHKLWEEDWRGRERTFMWCYYSKKSKLYYFFLLFKRVSRPSDVLI